MNKWRFIQTWGCYVDFDKEVMACGDDGDTSLDVRLTFNTESRVAYMNVAWHNDDGNTLSLVGDRDIEWDAAMRLIAEDAPDLIMERLKEVK